MSATPLWASLLILGVAAAVLVLSVVLVGRVAERFGENPRWCQLRMLPFTAFGPFIAWMILSRRGGGPGGFA